MSDLSKDISDPREFFNDGRMRTLQFKRIDGEQRRRAFVDGYPLENMQGQPVNETDFLTIAELCQMLDAGQAYLDDVFEEEDDVVVTKGAACGPTFLPDFLDQDCLMTEKELTRLAEANHSLLVAFIKHRSMFDSVFIEKVLRYASAKAKTDLAVNSETSET